MAEEAGLAQVLDTLRWRWKVFVPIALGVFLISVLYVESLPSTFDSQAVVALGPRPDVETAGPEAVRVIGPKYVAYVTSPATIAIVAADTGTRPDVLEDAMTAEIATDTGNMSITVTLPDPDRAAAVAGGFAEQAVQFAENDRFLTAQLVAEALPATEPSGPPRKLLEAAGLALGLLLGLAVSFIVEAQRPRLRSWTDMARITGYRVIGRVPSSRRLKVRPTEALADPTVGAAFRTLRTNLDREALERPLDVLVVTSADQGDGKTTIAGLLAESIARLGTKVLLIDADIRRPNVARTFRVEARPGLSEVLRGTANLDEAIKPGWVEGLYILPTAVDPDASDLLVRRYEEIIEEARSRFDRIIVDTTPLLGVADARSLAASSSGVLLVITARQMADAANEAVLALETVKAPVIGVVANRLREASRAYAYTRTP